MSEIILHVGLIKTASTTLQNQYFPVCSGLNFLHRSTVPDIGGFINLVVNKNPSYLKQEEGLKILDDYLSEDKVNLISAESFSGQIFGTVGLPGLDFRKQILENLSTVYPDAKVLIVIRRQDALVKSVYREYLRQGGTESVARFYGEDNKSQSPIISRDYFLYKPYIDSIKKLFPKGVLVLAFEEFVKDQPTFLNKIDDFLGVENKKNRLTKTNNTRLGIFGLECSRLLNRLFKTQLNPAGFLPGLPLKINGKFALRSPVKMLHNSWPGKGRIGKGSYLSGIGRKIFDEVKSDNMELDKVYSLNLKRYGYY